MTCRRSLSLKFWRFRSVICVLVAVVVVCLSSLLLETFSSYDGNAKEDVDLKMNLYLLLEYRKLVDMINIPNSAAS